MSPLRLRGEELSVPQDKDTSPYRLRDANKGSWIEEPWATIHTAVLFALTQSQASETTSESAGYFKAQSSNSPITQKYIQCRYFQSWVAHLKWKTDVLWQKDQGFWRELRAWLQPSSAPASCITMHEPPGTRSQAWKGVPGGFSIHHKTCAPLSHRQLARTPASKVLTYLKTLLSLGWIHKADPPVFLEVLLIQNAY